MAGDLPVRVGALRGEARRLAGARRRRRDRDRLPPGPRIQPRPDGRRRQGFARLLHGALRAVPAQDRAHHRVPALLAQRRLRRVVSRTRCRSTRRSASPPRSTTAIRKDIDYPYFVTAHEVAHQWWAHQEVPANVQGAEFITESLAEYSALMVLKQKYGDAKMRRFLKYELDRYLLGRGTEQKGEQPLLRADGAAYVHYQKGALALYALQDAIGEEAMDDALVGVRRAAGASRGRRTRRRATCIAELRRVTPAASTRARSTTSSRRSRSTTMRAVSAAGAQAPPDGRYDVDLVVAARRSPRRRRGQREGGAARHARSTSACRTRRATSLAAREAARQVRARTASRLRQGRCARARPASIRSSKLIDRDAERQHGRGDALNRPRAARRPRFVLQPGTRPRTALARAP